MSVVIGMDLDNTIVSYDALFAEAAVSAGFIEQNVRASKHELRERLREAPGGEERWTRLQAEVYGPRMRDAVTFPGVEAFIARARAAKISMYVVSHRSQFAAAAPDGPHLHAVARAWLERVFPADVFAGVFFEETRTAKIERIAALGCTHFIDDLAEVFLDASFPSETARWLFDPSGTQPVVPQAERFADWPAMEQRLEEEIRVRALASALCGEPVEAVVRARRRRKQSRLSHSYAIAQLRAKGLRRAG